MDADALGKKLNIDWSKISKSEFAKGMQVEQEHRNITHGDPIMTAKIVLVHLKELPDYYTRLNVMESKAHE